MCSLGVDSASFVVWRVVCAGVSDLVASVGTCTKLSEAWAEATVLGRGSVLGRRVAFPMGGRWGEPLQSREQ